jgi:SAM-dependent methyltransferase
VADWNPDFYKTGYEGFERAENFPTAEALADYRRLLLDKTRHQVGFIGRQTGGRPVRVFEVASGNGRLLIGLAQAGLLGYGFGLDIAQSRIEFATRWACDAGITQVRQVAADALTLPDQDPGTFDLAVCITGAFNYFQPIRDTAPDELLARMRKALKPGGQLLLELYELPQARLTMLGLSDGRLRTWQPLPAEDRFAYYLDDSEYWAERQTIRHGKIFIGRDGRIDAGREEVLKYYQEAELTALLEQAGFTDVQLFGDFDGGPHRPGHSTVCVALARLAAGR